MDEREARGQLGPHDFGSPTWKRLKDLYEARLARLRRQNDAIDKDEKATALLRGQIMDCKYFLDLDKPAPEIAADDR